MADTERIALDSVRDLIVIGAPLPFAVLDASGTLLLNQGQTVGSERQFEMLVDRGAWCERLKVEEVRLQRSGGAAAGKFIGQRHLTLFDQWEQLTADLETQNRTLGRGTGHADLILPLVPQLIDLVQRDGDVAIYLCIRQDLKRTRAYAAAHPVHCAVVCALAAQNLGWPADRVHSLVGAAMTMNASFIDLQNLLAEDPEPPTKKQREQIHAHPHGAAKLLREAGLVDAEWLQTVEDHHERGDGQGYPRGAGDVPATTTTTAPITITISDSATLLRLVDVYVAKVSPRRARAALTPQVSAQQLFQQHGKSAREAPLAISVIRTLGGPHPPGALVQLKSGEVGVVARRPKTGTHPIVATLSNALGEPSTGSQQRDSADPQFAISSALLNPTRFQRILPERVYGMLMAQT